MGRVIRRGAPSSEIGSLARLLAKERGVALGLPGVSAVGALPCRQGRAARDRTLGGCRRDRATPRPHAGRRRGRDAAPQGVWHAQTPRRCCAFSASTGGWRCSPSAPPARCRPAPGLLPGQPRRRRAAARFTRTHPSAAAGPRIPAIMVYCDGFSCPASVAQSPATSAMAGVCSVAESRAASMTSSTRSAHTKCSLLRAPSGISSWSL
jgi:hypothetical protein